MKKVIFTIKGMHCTACVMNIDGDLEDSCRVKSSKTNYARSQTVVEFEPEVISEEEIIEIIGKTGYAAAPLNK